MKNQYVGDVNDYRKYGLLRLLVQNGGFKVGVCWMLTPDDERNDGNILSYLDTPLIWRKHDPELYDFLQHTVNIQGRRDIKVVEEAQIIPKALFYSSILEDNASQRQDYFATMIHLFKDVDLVFFDPDNGLEVASVPLGRRNSAKYLFYKEIITQFDQQHSILIYQHYPRESREIFHRRIHETLQSHIGNVPMYVISAGSVAYFLLCQDHHHIKLQPIMELLTTHWKNQIIVQELSS